MALFRDDHKINTKRANPTSRPLPKAEQDRAKKFEDICRSKIALLSPQEQKEFTIIPTNPREAIPLVKKFATVGRIHVVDESKTLLAAEAAAVRQTPSLKGVFDRARHDAAAIRDHHAKVAAAQAAARKGKACPRTTKKLGELINSLDN